MTTPTTDSPELPIGVTNHEFASFVFLTSIWLCDKKTTLRWQIQGVSTDLFPDILRINIYWHFSGSNMTSKLTTEPPLSYVYNNIGTIFLSISLN